MSGNKHIAKLVFCAILAGCGPIRTVNNMDKKMTEMNENMKTMIETMEEMAKTTNEMAKTTKELTNSIAGNSKDASAKTPLSMLEIMNTMNELLKSGLEKLETYEELVPDVISGFSYIIRVLSRYAMAEDADVLSKIVDATAYVSAQDFQTLLKKDSQANREAAYQKAVDEFFRLFDATAKRVHYSLVPIEYNKTGSQKTTDQKTRDMIELYAIAATLGTVSGSAKLNPDRQLPKSQWMLFNGRAPSEGDSDAIIQKYPSLIYLIQKALSQNSKSVQHDYFKAVQDFERTGFYMLQLHRIYLTTMTLAGVCPELNPYEHGVLTYPIGLQQMVYRWKPKAPETSQGEMTNVPIEMLNRSAGVTEFLTDVLKNNSHLYKKIVDTNFWISLVEDSPFKILENMQEMPEKSNEVLIPNNVLFNKALRNAKEANKEFFLQIDIIKKENGPLFVKEVAKVANNVKDVLGKLPREKVLEEVRSNFDLFIKVFNDKIAVPVKNLLPHINGFIKLESKHPNAESSEGNIQEESFEEGRGDSPGSQIDHELNNPGNESQKTDEPIDQTTRIPENIVNRKFKETAIWVVQKADAGGQWLRDQAGAVAQDFTDHLNNDPGITRDALENYWHNLTNGQKNTPAHTVLADQQVSKEE